MKAALLCCFLLVDLFSFLFFFFFFFFIFAWLVSAVVSIMSFCLVCDSSIVATCPSPPAARFVFCLCSIRFVFVVCSCFVW